MGKERFESEKPKEHATPTTPTTPGWMIGVAFALIAIIAVVVAYFLYDHNRRTRGQDIALNLNRFR